MAKPFERPSPIYVFCAVAPTKRNGMKETITHRVGACQSEKEIPALIAADRKAMGQTYGGLIEPVSLEGRTYRAFRAEWTEIAI